MIAVQRKQQHLHQKKMYKKITENGKKVQKINTDDIIISLISLYLCHSNTQQVKPTFNGFKTHIPSGSETVSYTHLTLPTIYSV